MLSLIVIPLWKLRYESRETKVEPKIPLYRLLSSIDPEIILSDDNSENDSTKDDRVPIIKLYAYRWNDKLTFFLFFFFFFVFFLFIFTLVQGSKLNIYIRAL